MSEKIASNKIYPKWVKNSSETYCENLDPKINYNTNLIKDIRFGTLEELRERFKHPDFSFYVRSINVAINYDKSEIAKYLLKNFSVEEFNYQDFYESSLRNINSEIFSYIEENYIINKNTRWVVANIAQSGNYEHYMKHFPKDFDDDSNLFMEDSGLGGSLQIVKHLASLTTDEISYMQAINGAIKNNHLNLLKDLIKLVEFDQGDFELCLKLALFSTKDMVEYLLDLSLSMYFSVWETAIFLACERDDKIIFEMIKNKLTPIETDKICDHCGIRIDQHLQR